MYHSKVKSILADLTSTKSILPRLVAVFMILIILPVTTIGIITTKTASNDLLEQGFEQENRANQ